MQVWSDVDNTIDVYPIAHNEAENANLGEKHITATLVGGEWNVIDIRMGDFGYDYLGHIYQIKIANAQNQILWLNNILFYGGEGELVRTLTSSNIGTICLDKAVLADNFSGATFYEIAYKEVVDGEPYKIFFDQVDHLEAGKPYIFEPTEGATEIRVVYSGAAVGEAGSHNGLVGTFVAIDDAENGNTVLKDNYLVSQNRIRKCGNNCKLGANRAYIVMVAVPAEETAAPVAARRISLGTQATDMATDLESLSGEENATKIMVDGVLFVLRHGQMYDATGRLVK